MPIALVEPTVSHKLFIRDVLLKHTGKARAITGKELAKMLSETDDRKVRHFIRELIGEGLPVASSVIDPKGYFIVENMEEARIYMVGLRSRLIEDALRRRDFKLAVYKHLYQDKQARFFL